MAYYEKRWQPQSAAGPPSLVQRLARLRQPDAAIARSPPAPASKHSAIDVDYRITDGTEPYRPLRVGLSGLVLAVYWGMQGSRLYSPGRRVPLGFAELGLSELALGIVTLALSVQLIGASGGCSRTQLMLCELAFFVSALTGRIKLVHGSKSRTRQGKSAGSGNNDQFFHRPLQMDLIHREDNQRLSAVMLKASKQSRCLQLLGYNLRRCEP